VDGWTPGASLVRFSRVPNRSELDDAIPVG
jgi:hypothetical protein